MRVRWLVLTVVGLFSLVAACGDDGDTPSDGGGSPGPAGTGEATSTATPDPEERPQTIAEAFAARSAVMAENQLAIEAAIQGCMAEQGFEYTASADGGDVFIGEFDEGDFAERFGYGVSTLSGGLVGDFGLGGGPREDPNQSYVQSLNDSQRSAYYEALFGASPDGTGFAGSGATTSASGASVAGGSDDGPSFIGVGNGGCTAAANLEVYGEEQPLSFTPDLFAQMQEMSDQVDADSRVIEAWESWASCMADAGYPFSDEEEIIRDLGARFEAITGQQSPRAGGGFTIVEGTLGAAGAQEPDYDVTALKALQDDEREIAAVGAGCREEHVSDVETEVRNAIERTFLADNPELLDQLLGPASGS